MTERVQVVVRVRPLQYADNPLAVVPLDERRICVANRRVYHVDRVFGTEDTTELIFYDSVVSLVDKFLAGFNTTVLAYGQTGSGKTFTMSGITPLVLRYIVERMGGKTGELSFQCVEVYGEVLRDLLTSDPVLSAKHLQLHDAECTNGGNSGNGATGVVVVGAARVKARSIAEIEEIIGHSTRMRTTGATNMNEHSSRSHSIFTVFNHKGQSKLNLVDLAGSERNKKTHNIGLRFRESIAINGGLLALGNVIRALSRNHFQCPETPRHVPYRTSKLTRLLQDSLGGNSTTLLIACVASDAVNSDETTRTLQYSARAMQILNEPLPRFDERIAAARTTGTGSCGPSAESPSNNEGLGELSFSAVEVAELRRRVAELEGQVRRCREELKNDESVFAQQIEDTRLLLEENEMLKRRVDFLEGRHTYRSSYDTAAMPPVAAPAPAGEASMKPNYDGAWWHHHHHHHHQQQQQQQQKQQQQQQQWIPDPLPQNPNYVRDTLRMHGMEFRQPNDQGNSHPLFHLEQGVASEVKGLAADREGLLHPKELLSAAKAKDLAYSRSLPDRINRDDRIVENGVISSSKVWGSEAVMQTAGEGTSAAEREEQLSLLAKEALYYQNSNSELRRRLRTVLAMYEAQQREAAMLRAEVEQIHELIDGKHCS